MLTPDLTAAYSKVRGKKQRKIFIICILFSVIFVKGFMVVARFSDSNDTTPIGTFFSVTNDVKLVDCDPGVAVSSRMHLMSIPPTQLWFNWLEIIDNGHSLKQDR